MGRASCDATVNSSEICPYVSAWDREVSVRIDVNPSLMA